MFNYYAFYLAWHGFMLNAQDNKLRLTWFEDRPKTATFDCMSDAWEFAKNRS